ncbi:MAG TPA: DUF2690 domain-containing protein [Ktedonobacteraceae bacterium]|jgi:hypothetical protein
MITFLQKHHQTARIIFLVTLTGLATCVLLLASTVLHISVLSPFSFVQAATTCASTRGTQQALCEQQDPTAQGCAADAQTIEFEAVYTARNTLIGEVDLRRSPTCKTLWIRTIAYASAQQVQAIDAIISFSTGQKEEVKKTVVSSGQAMIAVTKMVFVPLSKMPTTWEGVFYVQGQTQPITIPVDALLNPAGLQP